MAKRIVQPPLKFSDGLIHEIMANDPRSAHRTFKRVIRVDGRVFRTAVYLNTSFPGQCAAELAVLVPAVGFSILLTLHGQEVRACREYHGAPAIAREARVQGWLHDTDSQLLEIGRQIMRGG